ncbi:hypothetical protein FKP32DRAFT_16053 [Trametes sanguinea]|nr:hypothetical protein FKP32DRAFT_16053 [Trametes sanguinea]
MYVADRDGLPEESGENGCRDKSARGIRGRLDSETDWRGTWRQQDKKKAVRRQEKERGGVARLEQTMESFSAGQCPRPSQGPRAGQHERASQSQNQRARLAGGKDRL